MSTLLQTLGVLLAIIVALTNLPLEDPVCLDEHVSEVLQQHLLLLVCIALLEQLLQNSTIELAPTHTIQSNLILFS